jgi:anti-sigma regulatory factor (Ser/Thr protein kinase)
MKPLRLDPAFRILDSTSVGSQPPYHAELCLPADYGSPALAREFAEQMLSRWDYRGRRDDVVLAVSELVANALVHAHSAPILRLRAIPGSGGQPPAGIRIEVSDDSPVLPAVRGSGPAGGLGLKLVERMSAGWGAITRDGGKVVWCELLAELDRAPVLPEATAA